jgi:hypothetical protein
VIADAQVVLRDDKAKWAKVGLPDAGQQARVQFWIVPARGVPALALPHGFTAFRRVEQQGPLRASSHTAQKTRQSGRSRPSAPAACLESR